MCVWLSLLCTSALVSLTLGKFQLRVRVHWCTNYYPTQNTAANPQLVDAVYQVCACVPEATQLPTPEPHEYNNTTRTRTRAHTRTSSKSIRVLNAFGH